MIQNSAVLVELNISVWSARRYDRSVSEEVAQSKQASRKAGNYNKHLLAGSHELEEIMTNVAAIRQWHYKNTLPWSDSGARILPVKGFNTYMQKVSDFERKFAGLVDVFLQEYPRLILEAERELGVMFDINEYPTVEGVRRKFNFSVACSPLPVAGDFRIDVGEQAMEALKSTYERTTQARVEGAMKDAWGRLHDCLSHISNRLGGEKTIFRDSMVENALELCSVLTSLNITNDQQLEDMRKQVESMFLGVDPVDLRKDTAFRASVKTKVDSLLGMFV